MIYTPEGISPRFSSIACPNIPASFQLEWTFRSSSSSIKQTKAVIQIFYASATTALKTITLTGAQDVFDLKSAGIVWEKERAYEWCVTTTDSNNYSATSVKGKFYYIESPEVDPIVWDSGPVAYERLGARKYFDKISTNILEVLSDYVIDSVDEQKMYNNVVDNLFVGEIVPSRQDFRLLEDAIRFLYKKDAFTITPSVVSMINDGLGANDIHKVYDLFRDLLKQKPKPPTKIELTVPTIDVPKMTSVLFVSSGKEDTTVDVKWESPAKVVDKLCTVILSGLSPSEDVRYYYCEYQYGPKDNPFVCKMFYRPSDLARINNTIQFYTRYDVFFTSSTIGKAYHLFTAKAVDQRSNESGFTSQSWAAPPGFKSPLGLSKYEVTFEKAALTATKPNPSATYNALYSGTNKTVTHTLAKNQEGVYFYRARYVDLTGQVSDWEYSSGNKFDPLKPPAVPKGLTVNNNTYNQLGLGWSATTLAEGYNVWIERKSNAGKSIDAGNKTSYTFGASTTGALNDGEAATLWVQAYNRAGKSDWASIKGTTKVRPPVVKEQKASYAECWRTGFSYRGSSVSAGWNTSGNAANELIQGMWIELRDGVNTDGVWVPKGQTYGNYKSLAFIDYAYWQTTLKGKEITDVKLWLERKSTQHGYPNDGRYIKVWTHNYASKPSGEPTLSNGTEIWNTNFGRGDAHYVDLPIKFGEALRDGTAKGFALHTDFRTSDTDRYTYCRFDESKIWVKITFKDK